MFGKLENRTYFLFAGLNLLWIPIVFLFYPETAGRSLESIEVMFSSNSLLNRNMERTYRDSEGVIAAAGGRKRMQSEFEYVGAKRSKFEDESPERNDEEKLRGSQQNEFV